VILLDEPTVGLDPMQGLEIRALIGELGQENHGVILSTHLLAEVQATCTHVQIMHSGRLVYNALHLPICASNAHLVACASA
jgi:ABC-2 type transport system ATP-binding protein